MPLTISTSPRVRPSPYYDAVLAEGAVGATPYNHMLLPIGYGDPMAEYWRLINGVAMWDVAAQRQVELRGPDAARLAQALAPRQIAEQPEGMGWYVPICNHDGVLLNDPILLKLASDRFWLSIADSDMLFWAQAIAGERGLNVEISEPDVSPLAVQGPKAVDVVASIFGDSVRDLKYFEFTEHEISGIPLMLARSGWSKQGGFELYLMDGSHGSDLWNLVKEAGRPWDIGPGNPNAIERIESGLLSWGGDTDARTNPYEVRMGRFVDLESPDDTIGIHALRKIKAEGPKRHQLGVKLGGGDPLTYSDRKGTIRKPGCDDGLLTATAYSPRLQESIGLCLVPRTIQADDDVQAILPDGSMRSGVMCKLPFL